VFIRSEACFVHVNINIINIKNITMCRPNMNKELWRTKLHWVGKGMGLRV
jgi:hypothetical protein